MSGIDAEDNRTACVFCGATDRKISKEHVWSKWLREFIELGEGPPIAHTRTRSLKGETTSREDWFAIPIDWEVKGPCKPCNETWMNDLEAECRPVLIPMLRNEKVPLDASACHSLTKWLTLKVLMGQLGHPADMVRAIPPASYHRFYHSRALPTGAQAWTGRYDGSGHWPCDYQHLGLFMSGPSTPEPDSPNAYFAAFTIGYVALAYFGHEIEGGPVFGPADGLDRYFTPIWPDPGAVNWPPSGLLSAEGLEAVIRSLEV